MLAERGENYGEDLMGLIEGRIEQEMKRKMGEFIGDILGIRDNDLETIQQMSTSTLLLTIVGEYNQMHQNHIRVLAAIKQQHREALAHKQRETDHKITELQTKLDQLSRFYEQKQRQQSQKYQIRLSKMNLDHGISSEKLRKQIEDSQTRIRELAEDLSKRISFADQQRSTILRLQGQIERYEYQLQQKNTTIAGLTQEIETAVKESQDLLEKVGQYEEAMMETFSKSLWNDHGLRERIQEEARREEQVRALMEQFCAFMQSNINSVITGNEEEVYDEKLILQSLEELSQETGIKTLKELKQKYKGLESGVQKLATSHRQQHIRHQNLSSKYMQFLKQTESKLQQCKTRITALELQKTQLTKTNTEITEQLHQKSQQTTNLLHSLQKTLESHKALESTLTQKTLKIDSLTQTLNQTQQKSTKDIQALTLEIQSLKESISSLRNVVSLERGEEKGQRDRERDRDREGMVVQQMIDKTYEIRLENLRLGEKVEVMERRIQGLEAEKIRLKEENKELELQLVTVTDKLHKTQTQNTTLTQHLQTLTTQTTHLQQSLQTLQTHHTQTTHNLTTTQHQNTTLTQTLQQLTTQLHEHQAEKQRLQKELARLEEQFKGLVVRLEGDVGGYQRMELLRLEIFVLREIVGGGNGDGGRGRVECQVQVDLGRFEEDLDEDEQENTAQTLRTRNRRSSIGCLVRINPKSTKQNQSPTLNQPSNQPLHELNKTCKLRQSPTASSLPDHKTQILQLTDLLNYLIHYLKGYTRNGIRKNSWLTAQGEEYLLRVQSSKNIKQKYGVFQRVRVLMAKNGVCRQLVKEYQAVAEFYFGGGIMPKGRDTMASVGAWQSFSKTDLDPEQTPYK